MVNQYISQLGQGVERTSVKYQNRYGMSLVGDLYAAKDMDQSRQYPALVIGAPYGGVKEQGPCVYANEMVNQGFVVLTFDQSFMGESEGVPRHVSSPDIFVENFSAGVDFLGLQHFVDRERIGVIGICGSGGFALSAAQVDTRIKAVATCSMYDMSAAGRDSMDSSALLATKDRLARQRWMDVENGSPESIPYFPETPLEQIPKGLDPITDEWMRFYAVKRGHHPRARGGFTTTSELALLNVRLLDFIDEISPRPILFIVGDRAHSKCFSEIAYEKANEPKELYIVEDAEHIDLYDRTDRIPFEKLSCFFRASLK